MRPRWIVISAILVLNLLALIFLQGPLGWVHMFKSPSSAMEPTIRSNEFVSFEKYTLWSRNPKRGEIVLFKGEGLDGLQKDRLYIKRVVGLPSEHVVISNEALLVNGREVTITNQFGPIRFYATPTMGVPSITNIVVPADHYFLMGDNSSNSLDSRIFGPVPLTNINGLLMK